MKMLPCPFCANPDIDSGEWMDNKGNSGPGCPKCDAHASPFAWNKRAYSFPPVTFPTMLRKMWAPGDVQQWIDEYVNRYAAPEEETRLPWLGPFKDPAKALDELRRSVAELIGADQETWPKSKNAPVAIAAVVANLQREMKPVLWQFRVHYPESDVYGEWITISHGQVDYFKSIKNHEVRALGVIKECE